MNDPAMKRRLASVAPERRALVEARIAALEAHLAIAKATASAAASKFIRRSLHTRKRITPKARVAVSC